MAERARRRGKQRKAKAAASNGSGKPRKVGVGHNSGAIPDEVYHRWLSKIELADNAHQRAHAAAKTKKSELSNTYKAAKNDGCDVDAIREARRLDKLDRNQVAMHYAETG